MEASERSKLYYLAAFAVLAALAYPVLVDKPATMHSKEKHVVVVGGGLAGIAASIQALQHGARVSLIDKEPKIGGNSAKASSGINGQWTETQKAYGIEDNADLFISDTLISGGGLSETELVKILVDSSNDAIEFLKSNGVRLDALSQCGGHSRPRTHRAKPIPGGKPINIGWEIISKLTDALNTTYKDKLTIINNARATDLLMDQTGTVNGVRYEDTKTKQVSEVRGTAVVLTTGGFSYDRDGFLKQYAPSIAHLSTTNGPFATGDGVRMAIRVGAGLSLMDQVQVHPTSFVDPAAINAPTRILAPEALRGVGGILLNAKGERFVNELGLRDHVTKEIFSKCQTLKTESGEGPFTAYLVLNDKGVEDFSAPLLGFYKSKGLIKAYANAKEMAAALNMESEVLESTITNYNKFADEGKDEFGKTVFPLKFSTEEQLSVMIITPSIHYTMGGIRISKEGQVMREDNEPIPGLFAAGEVTGGLHGANRLAGNSLLECAVFGRIAGKSAVHF